MLTVEAASETTKPMSAEYEFAGYVIYGNNPNSLASFMRTRTIEDMPKRERYILTKEMCLMRLEQLTVKGLPHEHITESLENWPAEAKSIHPLLKMLRQLVV